MKIEDVVSKFTHHVVVLIIAHSFARVATITNMVLKCP